jgi:hypothetical protein
MHISNTWATHEQHISTGPVICTLYRNAQQCKKKKTSPVSRSRHVMISNSLGLPVGGMDMPVRIRRFAIHTLLKPVTIVFPQGAPSSRYPDVCVCVCVCVWVCTPSSRYPDVCVCVCVCVFVCVCVHPAPGTLMCVWESVCVCACGCVYMYTCGERPDLFRYTWTPIFPCVYR